MASTYQYWRLSFNGPTNGAGTNVVSIAEWKFFDGSDTQVATSGGTASASTTLSGTSAANAFDGNTSTLWASTAQPSSGSPQWLQYQFSSAITASFISLTITGDVNFWFKQAPTAFLIQGSPDGTTWTTIETYTGVLWLYGASQVQYFDASTATGNARASQVAIEAVTQGSYVRTSQVAIEVLGGSNPNAKVSQLALEILGGSNPMAKLSQVAIEVMYPYTQTTPQPILEFVLP